MAINTDAPHATGVLGESAALQSDFGDTEKLLDISKELKGELNHKSDTYSIKSQNEKTENDGSVPPSPSRVDFSRASSPTPGEREPCSFIWVAVISCFCPAVPINVFALYFAHMVSTSSTFCYLVVFHVNASIKMCARVCSPLGTLHDTV